MTKQSILENLLDMWLSQKQLEYIAEYWNAFYNEPEKYSIYADMVKNTMLEKSIK